MKVYEELAWCTAPQVLRCAALLGLGLCSQAFGQGEPVGGASGEPLFPTMAITSTLKQTAAGEEFPLGSVRKVFAGTWMVVQAVEPSTSQQPSVRRLVDFGEQRLIEVDSASHTFWTMTFDRYSDLLRRFETADFGAQPLLLQAGRVASGETSDRSALSSTLVVGSGASSRSVAQNAGGSVTKISSDLGELLAASTLVHQTRAAQPGVVAVSAGLEHWTVQETLAEHTVASAAQGSRATALTEQVGSVSQATVSQAMGSQASELVAHLSTGNVWLTDAVRFSSAALHALERYESMLDVAQYQTTALDLIAVARRSSGGLLPVRAESRVFDVYGEPIEFVHLTTSLQSAEGEIASLLEIPDGYVEVSAPIESLVLLLEQERRLEQLGKGYEQ